MSKMGEVFLVHLLLVWVLMNMRPTSRQRIADWVYDYYNVPILKALFLPGPLGDRAVFRKYWKVLTIVGAILYAVIYVICLRRWLGVV